MSNLIITPTEDSEFDLFDFSNLDPIDIKKESIASNLSALISFSGIKRKELAKKLNQKESQLSKTLSGKENLTIKTISKIAFVLDYDFEIVFHKNNSIPAYIQPWESPSIFYHTLISYFISDINYKNINQNCPSTMLQSTLNLIENIPTKKDIFIAPIEVRNNDSCFEYIPIKI